MGYGEFVPQSVRDSLPTAIRDELARLPAEQQGQFVEEYQRKAKSIVIAYLLWLVGFHYLYFGKIGVLIIYSLTILVVVGLVWVVVDIFRIPGMVRDYNMDLATETMRNLKIIRG